MNFTRKISILMMLLMLTACGEPYRATYQRELFTGEEEFVTREGERVSNTNIHVDQRIFNEYVQEMVGDEDDINDLHDSISAFDIVLTKRDNGEVQLNARIALGCNNGVMMTGNSTDAIVRASAVNGPIGFFPHPEYYVEFRCTTVRCEEMIAAIRKTSGAHQALILAPLAISGGTGDQLIYGIRDVNLLPYYAEFDYNNVADFERDNSCTAVQSISNPQDDSFIGEINDILDIDLNLNENVVKGLEFIDVFFDF